MDTASKCSNPDQWTVLKAKSSEDFFASWLFNIFRRRHLDIFLFLWIELQNIIAVVVKSPYEHDVIKKISSTT
jgi:hypothetical protein